MIKLHRINNKEFFLNIDQIVFIEATPDTVITLATDSKKLMVKESVEEVVRLAREFKRSCFIMDDEKGSK